MAVKMNNLAKETHILFCRLGDISIHLRSVLIWKFLKVDLVTLIWYTPLNFCLWCYLCELERTSCISNMEQLKGVNILKYTTWSLISNTIDKNVVTCTCVPGIAIRSYLEWLLRCSYFINVRNVLLAQTPWVVFFFLLHILKALKCTFT